MGDVGLFALVTLKQIEIFENERRKIEPRAMQGIENRRPSNILPRANDLKFSRPTPPSPTLTTRMHSFEQLQLDLAFLNSLSPKKSRYNQTSDLTDSIYRNTPSVVTPQEDLQFDFSSNPSSSFFEPHSSAQIPPPVPKRKEGIYKVVLDQLQTTLNAKSQSSSHFPSKPPLLPPRKKKKEEIILNLSPIKRIKPLTVGSQKNILVAGLGYKEDLCSSLLEVLKEK